MKQGRLADEIQCPPMVGIWNSNIPTLEATQGRILSQSPTDATRFWGHLYGS